MCAKVDYKVDYSVKPIKCKYGERDFYLELTNICIHTIFLN